MGRLRGAHSAGSERELGGNISCHNHCPEDPVTPVVG